MHKRSTLYLLVIFLLTGANISWAFIGDIIQYYKERAEIRKHARNITVGVKDLYRERTSIRAFIQSSNNLIAAYRAIKDKKANIPALIDIAKNIDILVRNYNNLAPKASRIYNSIKPDLDYFSKLKGEEGNQKYRIGNKEFVLKSIPESRINQLARANGWSRVWDAIQNDPFNIFRWGRLTDEYKLGKAEGQYALKCAQIAFEGASYYTAAQDYLKELLYIRKQISAIVEGDWTAILTIPNTIQAIQNAAPGVEDFGTLMNHATKRFTKHFEELGKLQEEYMVVYSDYHNKYIRPVTGEPLNVTTRSYSQTNSANATKVQTDQIGTYSGGSTQVDLKKAMEIYQRAYQEYTKIVQNPYCTPEQRDAAIKELQRARAQYEAIKAAAGR